MKTTTPATLPDTVSAQRCAAQQIAAVIQYHGPTDTRGSRFSITLPRWNNTRRYFPFDYAFADTLDNSFAVFRAHGIPVAGVLDLGDRYAFAIDWAHRPAVFRLFGIPE